MNDLYKDHQKAASGPVECLGIKFPSEQARREHFSKLLAEKLKDPAFRRKEGFPQGTDEAILAMSEALCLFVWNLTSRPMSGDAC